MFRSVTGTIGMKFLMVSREKALTGMYSLQLMSHESLRMQNTSTLSCIVNTIHYNIIKNCVLTA